MFDELQAEPALTLSLEGSVGSFQVGTGSQGSLEVRYLMTHVGLDFAGGAPEQLLSHLAPVREVFDFANLGFEEIMQRDIDDARVSAELIPYLLDERSAGVVKFFPPLVVVVLPTEENSIRPAGRYPEVTVEALPPEPGRNWELQVTRSGHRGAEVFQFEQPLRNGKPLDHDMVRLRLNTYRSRLVIVDGQHRAMALLALYRNLHDGWTHARAAPFREYYAQWTPELVQRFQLSRIKLPVVLCTVPELDNRYPGDFDLKKAARSIFLTLNKTARKVSESRNRLLDDNDLIAVFMRRTLAKVKERNDFSPNALRIWNIELDQIQDKQRIQSAIAITGVNHVYYMVEHALLDQEDVKGVAPRSGRFSNRTRIEECLNRLNGRAKLGARVAGGIKRDSFTAAAAEVLGREYDQRYGDFLLRAFDQFAPFDRHCRAAVDLRGQIEQFEDRQLHPILFEGQNIHRVFEAHRQNLERMLGDKPLALDLPQVRAVLDRLNGTASRVQRSLATFRANRAAKFLADVDGKKHLRGDDGALAPLFVSWLDDMYEHVFSSVAFQTALVCGFLCEVEKAEMAMGAERGPHAELDRERAFDEYITQLNQAFIPKTIPHLKRLLRVFKGEVNGDRPAEWRISKSNQTFRSVVHRAEMQPDQWPKYKYLLTEIWEPEHPVLANSLVEVRTTCRQAVFSSLHENYKANYCKEHRRLDDQLSEEERRQIFEQAYTAYAGFLSNVGAKFPLSAEEMRVAAATVSATAASEEAAAPLWESQESGEQ
ncbi:MAG TPA: DNA sulfur modification protein DndB [Azospirillaceae bacterium]|nr:DNA sulfur modification protein DndB [Azospirillaceae bacterium]